MDRLSCELSIGHIRGSWGNEYLGLGMDGISGQNSSQVLKVLKVRISLSVIYGKLSSHVRQLDW